MTANPHLEAIRALTADLMQSEMRSDIKIIRERTFAIAAVVILTLLLSLATLLIVLRNPPQSRPPAAEPVLSPAPIQAATVYIPNPIPSPPPTPTVTPPPALVVWLSGCCGCSCPPKK